MPIFDYICPNCGKKFEEFVKSYKDNVLCPDCKTLSCRNYSGEIFTATGKKIKKCSGNCKNCDGCK